MVVERLVISRALEGLKTVFIFSAILYTVSIRQDSPHNWYCLGVILLYATRHVVLHENGNTVQRSVLYQFIVRKHFSP